MAIKPKIVTLTNNSKEILNAIRNSASNNYRDYVPVATDDADSLRAIGAVIMDFPALQNEFLSALVNRIGKVMISSKMYENPWALWKKGYLEFGEVVEDIFVNIAKVQTFDPEVAENNVYKRVKPDVRSSFYIMNYQKFYKATTTQAQLKHAFLSWEGVNELISGIITSMYTAANYDEFQVEKYLLARRILDGLMNAHEIDAVSTYNMESIVSAITEASDNLTFLNGQHNLAGVMNATEKANQYIILSTAFNAKMNVEVLASAFNLDKVEFMGKRLLVDGFGNIDNARLDELFDGDDTYKEISDNEKAVLNTIPCVIVDENFFQIYDNLEEFTEKFNEEGLYWNHWLHVWKTFAVSPFANNILFIPDTPEITSVTITPDEVDINAGTLAVTDVSFQLATTVVTAGFAPKSVVYTISDEAEDIATVSPTGYVTIKKGTYAEEVEFTVTATSTFDEDKSDTATITIVVPEE